MVDTNQDVPEKYTALQNLTVEELEKLLYTAELSSNCKEDEAYYAAIEEVLLQKETENPSGRLPNIDDAWSSFQQNYSTPEADGLRLYEEPAHSKADPAKNNCPRKRKILRKISPLAAAIALVLFTSVIVQASGIDIFGAIARWTKETFSLSAPATEDKYGFMPLAISPELTDALSAQGFPSSFAPAWLPDGYTNLLVETHTASSASVIEFAASSGDGRTIFINFSKYFDGNAFDKGIYEKDGYTVEEYPHGTQLFHIFHNTTDIVAVWSDGTYVINIWGNLSLETMKEIIDSI